MLTDVDFNTWGSRVDEREALFLRVREYVPRAEETRALTWPPREPGWRRRPHQLKSLPDFSVASVVGTATPELN